MKDYQKNTVNEIQFYLTMLMKLTTKYDPRVMNMYFSGYTKLLVLNQP